MINITKQGNNVIVTSDNPNSFHIGNGELSVPLNTIYYVLDDESDFIQFNSTEKGKILFNGTIGDIQVNGNIVNRENILMELDNVFNSAAIGGEGGTAGVLAINGYDGYINLKSINGQSLIGSGNIEIEGGEGGTAGVNKVILGEEDYGWNAYQGDVKLTNKWMDLDDDGVAETYDIRIGNNEGSSLWFGFNSTDNSIKIEDNGSRLSFTVNPDILGGGGTAGVEAINLGNNIDTNYQKTGVVKFGTSWYNGGYDLAIGSTTFMGIKPIDNSIVFENAGATANGNTRCGIKVNEDNFKTINGESIFGTGDITIEGGGDSVEETDPVFTSWKNGASIVAGQNAVNGYSSFGTIISRNNVVVIGNSAKVQSDGGIAIGNGATVFNGTLNGVAIGFNANTDATFSTNINDVIKGDSSKNAYIKNANGTYTKILDLINNASGSSEPEQYIVSIENFWMYTKEEPYKKLWLQYIDSSNKNEIITKEIILEWTGTQSEYDALGEYDDSITYNIIEG